MPYNIEHFNVNNITAHLTGLTTEDELDINIVEPDLVSEAIRKTPQILSENEKKQARENIGAANANNIISDVLCEETTIITSEEDINEVKFSWFKTFIPKNTACKIVFDVNTSVTQISFYNTEANNNINSYDTIFENKRDITSFPYEYHFITKRDGYLMYNIRTNEVSATVNAKLYLEKLNYTEERLSEISDNVNNLCSKYKLYQFGETSFKQDWLGQANASNWASVAHGVVANQVEYLYVIKYNEANATKQLVFNLYEGSGYSTSTCFDKRLSTIIVSTEQYNSVSAGDIIKLKLETPIDFEYNKYYTLELYVNDQSNLRFYACDALDCYNLIQASYFKITNDGGWNVVSTYPSNRFNYGLLWGIYLGEDNTLDFNKDWQSKFHMNLLSGVIKEVEKTKEYSEVLFNKVTPNNQYYLNSYSFLGVRNNSDENYELEQKFTDFYFKKGHYYRLIFSCDDISQVKQFSVYNDSEINSYINGFLIISNPEAIKNPTENVIIDYYAEQDGYLMYNMKITAGYTFKVDVYELLTNIDIERLEEQILTGNNETVEDTDNTKHIVFNWFKTKLQAGKTYHIRLSQYNYEKGYLKTFSLYNVYTYGTIDDGYDLIKEYHNATILDKQHIIEYTALHDGYLMVNSYATTDKKVLVILYGTADNNADLYDIIDKKQNILSIKNQAKTLAALSTNKFPQVKGQNKDVYLTLTGDSIFAFQNVYNNDKLGVSAVPPTCDRTANANKLWNALKWGNALYRRFDYGKSSLLSGYDNSFSDDSQAVFTESGDFKTEYIGTAMREIAGNNTTNYQTTTKLDLGSFPYQFDTSENTWWQRNIPKRFSNSENASIQFTIPAGYSKFDFIFHAHIHGDNVTVSTNRNNGVVKINSKPNDWSNASEANDSVVDLSMTNYTDSNGGNDSYGIPNARLYFNITDTTVDTVVTITKTSDTSKYLIYWGITYWGTSTLPYALHINNMSVGGWGQGNIYNIRNSIFKYIHTDAIIMEMCYNNLSSKSIALDGMNNVMRDLKTYFESIDISLDNIGVWVPHCGVELYKNSPDTIRINTHGAERLANELGYNVIANVKKLCDDINSVYYEDITGDEFMKYLGGDGVHLGQNGHDVYQAIWESI